MQKKNGFTLVEIIVVIAISAIVLTMVGTTMVFMTNVSGNLLEEAEDIDMAKNIEKYLRGLVDDGCSPDNLTMTFPDLYNKSKNTVFEIDNDGNIKENTSGKTIFSNTRLSVFSIQQEGDFIKCKMIFESGKEFEFILGIA